MKLFDFNDEKTRKELTKWVLTIAGALAANILIAFIFYVLFGIEIHVYALAGITTSFGIVIDTSIIMVAHYSYWRNRKVFLAILAALLTSIGSLAVIFLLPQSQQMVLGFCLCDNDKSFCIPSYSNVPYSSPCREI